MGGDQWREEKEENKCCLNNHLLSALYLLSIPLKWKRCVKEEFGERDGNSDAIEEKNGVPMGFVFSFVA